MNTARAIRVKGIEQFDPVGIEGDSCPARAPPFAGQPIIARSEQCTDQPIQRLILGLAPYKRRNPPRFIPQGVEALRAAAAGNIVKAAFEFNAGQRPADTPVCTAGPA